jgi:hypothetical protein
MIIHSREVINLSTKPIFLDKQTSIKRLSKILLALYLIKVEFTLFPLAANQKTKSIIISSLQPGIFSGSQTFNCARHC